MLAVNHESVRIGSVARFRGQPRSKQWVAYSVFRLPGDRENSRPFLTQKAAIAWLQEQHDRYGEGRVK
jgi:hypothetical protein